MSHYMVVYGHQHIQCVHVECLRQKWYSLPTETKNSKDILEFAPTIVISNLHLAVHILYEEINKNKIKLTFTTVISRHRSHTKRFLFHFSRITLQILCYSVY